jgi:hypothetical protein
MTTRAGFAGILTGLITTIVLYPLYYASLNGVVFCIWIALAAFLVLMIGGGWLAARRSGSTQPGRCAVLGGLAGALAGTIVFCLWGSAVSGSVQWDGLFTRSAHQLLTQGERISLIIEQTSACFCLLFVGAGGMGTLGGWLFGLRRSGQADGFNKEDPQMAMNVSITAVPASMLAAVTAAAVFPRLADAVGSMTVLNLPLEVSLLLVLLSQLALTAVVPHETRQAEHRCGLDEVRMAAFVGIASAPVLTFSLLLADAQCFANPLVLPALLLSFVMSSYSLYALIRLVLPKRALLPAPWQGQTKEEAVLFGSISKSRGPRLAQLCIGCGLAMVLPLYAAVISVLININSLAPAGFSQSVGKIPWPLFLTQAGVSAGLCAAAIIVLILIYLFYLNLGRWFSKRNSQHSRG